MKKIKNSRLLLRTMPEKLGYYKAGEPVEIWTSGDDESFCMVTYVTDSSVDPITVDMVFMGYVKEFCCRN